MSKLKVEIRKGTYYDSITLMQLQAALMKLPGVRNAGVMLATDANKQILAQQGLLSTEAESARGTDLIISLLGENDAKVETALRKVDELLSRKYTHEEEDYLPKSLASAVKMLPQAGWILVSVPGRYAADIAREGLRLGKNIFLYSDNVSLDDELSLKKEAAEKGLLVMGPDCGTAMINGIGLGFANNVRSGPIGLIGASGTGLQSVMSRIHQLGSGVSHAIGTGGRDLGGEINGMTAHQALDLLSRNEKTRVVTVISKPPAPQVASALLHRAQRMKKHVVFNFIGHAAMYPDKADHIHIAASLDAAAEIAVKLTTAPPPLPTPEAAGIEAGAKYLRGLFSGGTLAYETMLMLQDSLSDLYSNIPLKTGQELADPLTSRAHTILDLGEDIFTVGRPHPMLDNTLRLERLKQEARDPEVALILLDVVLGYGAHPDPAAELAPAISRAIASAKENGRELEILALVIGTNEDPQGLDDQTAKLRAAGARIVSGAQDAAAFVLRRLQPAKEFPSFVVPDSSLLNEPFCGINVGVQTFAESLRTQEATVIHVDWRPPAGGDEKLMSILQRMKQK